jgi:hypothetical protein
MGSTKDRNETDWESIPYAWTHAYCHGNATHSGRLTDKPIQGCHIYFEGNWHDGLNFSLCSIRMARAYRSTPNWFRRVSNSRGWHAVIKQLRSSAVDKVTTLRVRFFPSPKRPKVSEPSTRLLFNGYQEGNFPGGRDRDMKLTPQLHAMPTLRMSGATPLLSLYTAMARAEGQPYLLLPL